MAEHRRVRRSDAGDGNMQCRNAVVRIRKRRGTAGTRADQFRSGFDPKVPDSRRAVARVSCRGVQRAEPRESDEPEQYSEQPDVRQIRGSRRSSDHAACIKVRVLETQRHKGHKDTKKAAIKNLFKGGLLCVFVPFVSLCFYPCYSYRITFCCRRFQRALSSTFQRLLSARAMPSSTTRMALSRSPRTRSW